MYVSKYLIESIFRKYVNVLISKGIEGKFIKTPSLTDKQAQRSFHIDRSLGKISKILAIRKNRIFFIYLDPTLRDLARRMVPLCSNHSLIVRFIEGKI